MSVETRFIASHATKGGMIAHIARRLIHLAMLAIPFCYYYFLIHLATPKILRLCILAFIFFIFLLEKLRIRMRLVLFGQRLHEASHISAFAWTMLSIGVILFFAPVSFAIPIVATCAFVDPLMGEMRLHKINRKIIGIVGLIVALFIWFACAAVYHFPMWYGVVLAPIAVAAEWPNLKWIDDNALMMLVPLIVVFLLHLCSHH